MQKDPELVSMARSASERAYAPYSNYHVGAAVRCSDGSVFTGCNVENASYGLTMCAERTAIFAAVAAGHRDFVRIVVATQKPPVPYPCGACLQVLAEWNSDLQILVVCPDKSREGTLAQFLPRRFNLKNGSHGVEAHLDAEHPEGRETL
jgi:cytidine deaminase